MQACVHKIAQWTIVLCLLTTVVEVIFSFTSTANLMSLDLLLFPLLIGPYLFLALMAWWQRTQSTPSWILFFVMMGLSLWALTVLGLDSYRYHTDMEYRMVQRMSGFLVMIIQWIVALLVGLVLLIRRVKRS